ncbi:MAG: uridine kinase, partial [Planctomycetota bacterium]
ALDHDLLAGHLLRLSNGETISHPVYDYKLHTRSEETQAVDPHDLIILEGILILHDARLRELMDLRVFIDTAPDICFIRRLKRDTAERGRTVDSVIRQYMETVRPMYLQFIEPSKQYADIFVSGEGTNSRAVDIVTDRISGLLAGGRQ